MTAVYQGNDMSFLTEMAKTTCYLMPSSSAIQTRFVAF